MEFGWVSLLPPLTAIFFALLFRHVFLSLIGGIVVGLLLLGHLSFMGTIDQTLLLGTSLLGEMWVLKTLAFAILVGSVMALISDSGGISGFVHLVQTRFALVTSDRSALMVTYVIGLLIFIESSITSLIAGTAGRPLSDHYGVSRAKLAYVCDSTSAPVCSIIVLNGWGALLLGLITTQISAGLITGESVTILLEAIPFNFYAWIALLVTFLTIWFRIDVGPMRHAKVEHDRIEELVTKGRAGYMLWPIVVMMVSVIVTLIITGDGNLLEGSGSSAIFYATLIAVLFSLFYYAITGGMHLKQSTLSALRGAKSMVGIATILFLAFAIGKVTQMMGTGYYLASFADGILSPALLGAIIFLISAVMAFATGTSWGTFSIMLPIAIPMAVTMDASLALAIGAVISGGVFGDHCSPISDTTIISSMAAQCDHIEHVRTQLPYALFSGFIALLMFLLAGYLTL